MRKKIIGRLVLCIFLLSTQQKIQASQSPWYKNGWKVAAAGWGVSASALLCLSIYTHKKKHELSRFNKFFKLIAQDKHRIANAVPPCLLGISTVFGLVAGLLYRHGNNQK